MKFIAMSLLLIVVALQYRLWVSDSGMREVWRLRREVAAQTEQNDSLKDRNRQLAAEVQDLKKGKSAIEERARTDLGMVGNNETFFQVAPKSAMAERNHTVMAAQSGDHGSTPGVERGVVQDARTPASNQTGNSPLALSASH